MYIGFFVTSYCKEHIMRTIRNLALMLTAVVLLSGCYTQFVMVDKTPPAPQEQVTWVVDSTTGDSVKVITQVDTIQTEDNRTCVWERDLMGYPHLRCYDSFYPRDWFLYNNSPWWYRNDPYWYDYNRCPRYYYYDQSCGQCRYTGTTHNYRRYDDHPYQNRTSEPKPEPSGPGGSSMYPRTRGVPDPRDSRGVGSPASVNSSAPSSPTASSAEQPRQSGQLTLPASEQKPVIIRGRSAGVPPDATAQAAPAPKPQAAPTGNASSTPPSQPPSSTPTTTQSSGNGASADSQPQQTPPRRNQRSW